jgi:UDP-N-acetylglucosamine/UDP-N-acetyl-alpha-D-glucosaminouronate 4-epimerase
MVADGRVPRWSAVRVLVTGGAGFIGSHLVDRLVEEGADVVVLDDLSTGFIENLNPSADLRVAAVTELDSLRDMCRGCEVIYHQAAARSVSRSVLDPLSTNLINTTGTLNVLLAAREAGIRRVVAASSSSVYGGASPRPTPESAPLVPRSPYAVSKVAAEYYLRVFHELDGLETVSLRYFNAYGPRQHPDGPYAAVIPLFIAALRAGRPPEIHGDGTQSRDFTYVDDVVAANLAAAQAPASVCAGKAYNVAAGRAYSLLELLHELEALLGVTAHPRFGLPRAGDLPHSLADGSAAARDLGHESSVDLREGLRRTIAWFLEHDRRSRVVG